jgi:hypothetical protein
MDKPLMPKATAVWLVDNTALSFEQIATFCELHILEVQAIADDEVAVGIVGRDPIANGELTRDEIRRCEADSNARLEMRRTDRPEPMVRAKGPRYTPVAKRADKPDAISWLLRNHPELSDAQVSRLIGTTKNTINAVRDRSHWNTPNITARDPMTLGLCTYADLDKEVRKARKKAGEEVADEDAPVVASIIEPSEEEPEVPAREPTPESVFGSNN